MLGIPVLFPKLDCRLLIVAKLLLPEVVIVLKMITGIKLCVGIMRDGFYYLKLDCLDALCIMSKPSG
jgi:hypothetical protein